LIDPRERLRIEGRHLQQLGMRLTQAGSRALAAGGWRVTELHRRLARCGSASERGASALRQSLLRLQSAARHGLELRAARLDALGARLQAMNPHAVLARGYAIATDANGRIVRDAKVLPVGATLLVRFARGRVESSVTRSTPAADPADESG
jgi:exodeoxyribonuclease VII large subunit